MSCFFVFFLNINVYCGCFFPFVLASASKISSISVYVSLGSNWTLTNNVRNISVDNLTLPISVHTALRAAKLIDDPLYGFNDIKLRWISNEDNWVFSNYFVTTTAISSSKRVDFIFDSIDTIASIYLNGRFLLFVNNQFLSYRVENVSATLAPVGKLNQLEIRFKSAIKQANYLAQTYSYRVPPDCVPDVQHGECHVNFIRKEQCSFSWDWGPCFAEIGINGPVMINLIDSFDFDWYLSVYPTQSGSINSWILNSSFIIEQPASLSLMANLAMVRFRIDELNYEVNRSISLMPPTTSALIELVLNNEYKVELWWPNGHGKQKLYNITAELFLSGQSIKKSKLFGFRSVQLIQEPIKTNLDGLSFYFRINNVDMFMKGSNWIPVF
jgi:beta-mannosidase